MSHSLVLALDTNELGECREHSNSLADRQMAIRDLCRIIRRMRMIPGVVPTAVYSFPTESHNTVSIALSLLAPWEPSKSVPVSPQTSSNQVCCGKKLSKLGAAMQHNYRLSVDSLPSDPMQRRQDLFVILHCPARRCASTVDHWMNGK